MALVDKIKVDLYGQYNNNTEHAYSYPDKITNQYSYTEATQWAAAITDPRALFQSVCKAGPCYMIYRHKNGYYYSYIERNANDSRGGLEMITIFVPNGYFATGYSVLASLKDLRTILIGSKRYDDSLVQNCISRVLESKSKELFPPKTQQNPTGQSIAAYRTYRDESELSELFTFLKQSEYTNIDKLLIVKDSDVKEGVTLQRISQPIKRVFTLVSSWNVHSDKNEIAVGDSFHITYDKEGCVSRVLDVKFDPLSSQYYRIDGNELILFGPEKLNITFNKRLIINVESADPHNKRIEMVEAVFDGRICDKTENGRLYALIPEDSIFEGSSAVLQVSAPKHETKQVSVNLSKMCNNYTISVVLSPKSVTVPVSFCFKDLKGDPNKDEYLPTINLTINETNSLLKKLQNEHRFYGYPAYNLGNGEFRVEIPCGGKSKHANKSEGRFSTWLKIIIISLCSFIVAVALVMCGYILRHYEVIDLPFFSPTSQTIQEPASVNSLTQSEPSDQVDPTNIEPAVTDKNDE